MNLILLAVFSYFFGSVPYGLIVAKWKGVDIMKVGSGNIGATNVIRALGAKLGIFVFLLDVLKGAVPSYATHLFVADKTYGVDTQAWAFVIGVVAILGHMFSPWLKFKGGKGIATGLGATLGSIPMTGLTAFGVMIILTIITRYVSLASLVAVATTIPISIWIGKDSPQVLPILAAMIVFIFYKHKGNIVRLRNGTESKFNFRKQETGVESKQLEKEEKRT